MPYDKMMAINNKEKEIKIVWLFDENGGRRLPKKRHAIKMVGHLDKSLTGVGGSIPKREY